MKRIQRKRTKGWRMPPNTVYVGRPTDFGNPFVVGEHVPPNTFWKKGSYFHVESRDHAVMLFTYWVEGLCPPGYTATQHKNLIIRRRLTELTGKDLCCWCSLDNSCHADVLLRLANAGRYK